MADQKAANVAALRAQQDCVRDNSIFREKVRSEKRHAYLNENFDFNPKNLVNVSEKLTRKNTLAASGAEQLTDLKTKIGSLTQLPKQKFMLPQTSA
jgi:hypothetical protein